MDDMQEKRRARLEEFVASKGGPRRCQELYTGVNESYVSQILHKHVAFGERAARNMEKKLRLPAMYFDTAASATDPSMQEILDLISSMSPPQRQAAAAMLRSFADAIGITPKKSASNGN